MDFWSVCPNQPLNKQNFRSGLNTMRTRSYFMWCTFLQLAKEMVLAFPICCQPRFQQGKESMLPLHFPHLWKGDLFLRSFLIWQTKLQDLLTFVLHFFPILINLCIFSVSNCLYSFWVYFFLKAFVQHWRSYAWKTDRAVQGIEALILSTPHF